MKNLTKIQTGRKIEAQVCKYLVNKGYKLIQQNYYAGGIGEIDLIFFYDMTLIFCEIRYSQTSQNFNNPIISRYKLFKLRKSISHWYRNNSHLISELISIHGEFSYRSDLVIVTENEGNLIYEHIKHVI